MVAHDGGTDERHLDVAACLDLRHGQRGIDIGFDAEGIGKRHDERKPQQESGEPDTGLDNVSFGDIGQTELRDRIAALDMDSMTPRDALELLYELKKLVY